MIARWKHWRRKRSRVAFFRLVCLIVFQFEFRPRTFTTGFYGKIYQIRAYDFKKITVTTISFSDKRTCINLQTKRPTEKENALFLLSVGSQIEGLPVNKGKHFCARILTGEQEWQTRTDDQWSLYCSNLTKNHLSKDKLKATWLQLHYWSCNRQVTWRGRVAIPKSDCLKTRLIPILSNAKVTFK